MNFHEVIAPFQASPRGKEGAAKEHLEVALPVPWPHWFLRELIKSDPSYVFGHKWLVWGLYDRPEFEKCSAVLSGEKALELSGPSMWFEEEIGFYRLIGEKADLNLWADDGFAGLRILESSPLLAVVQRICQTTSRVKSIDKQDPMWVLKDAPFVRILVEHAHLIDVLTVISAVSDDVVWFSYDGSPFPAWTLKELRATGLDGTKVDLKDVAVGLTNLAEWSAKFESVEALDLYTLVDKMPEGCSDRLFPCAPNDPIAPAMPRPLSLKRTADRAYAIETRKGQSSERLIYLLQEFQKPLGWVLSGDGL
jgi:hypothetical protein